MDLRTRWARSLRAIGTSALALLPWAGAALAQTNEIYRNPAPATGRAERLPQRNLAAALAAASKAREREGEREGAKPPATPGAEVDVRALRAAIQALRDDNESLRTTIADLNKRIAALSAAGKDAVAVLENERAARQKTVQDAREQYKANETLQAERSRLTIENGGLRQDLATAQSGLAKATEAVGASHRDLANARQGLVAADRRAAELDRDARTKNDELARATARLGSLEDRTRSLETELAAARRDGWLWAAAFAVLGAGLAGAAVRAWWPKAIKVVKPLSVSVGLGTWAIATPSLGTAPRAAFQLRTQWLPGASRVHASGPLTRRLTVAAVPEEVA